MHMTVADVARAKRCDVTTVRRAIRLGDLRATRAGARTYVVAPESVRRWNPRKYASAR